MTTTEQLIAQLRERHAKGLAKYGTTVDRNDLTPEQWAQHAIEEMLDGAAYLMRLKATLSQTAKPPMEDADALRIQRDSARADLERLEASHRMLGDAYDAARQDRDHALAKVARLEATIAMLDADLCTARETANVSQAASAEAHFKVVASVVRLDRALELGDDMHRAHPSEEWAAYKEQLAASRQCPAKASEAPGEGGDSGRANA